MNDDIVLLQPMPEPVETSRDGDRLLITYGIDGTENSFYAVPTGLTREEDPITYDSLRGLPGQPNPGETLENVPVNPRTGVPDFSQNPTRNMRMILSRKRLLARKHVEQVIASVTNGALTDSVHVPMEHIDRVFWQAVMRQNTVVPPLRRVTLTQYVRILMYGEAVQMGAAIGAIGKPYVEYFSDPFIIGLEDDNANILHYILDRMQRGGQKQEFYVFNTGGIGAESNDAATGPRYKKIPRELTLLLQEGLLRGVVKFEHDPVLGSDVAVAVLNERGEEVVDLRREWLPSAIYGDEEYRQRVADIEHRRYYGVDAQDKAGILRYTKVTDALLAIDRIPHPRNERELAWLLSFYWHVDKAYNTVAELVEHLYEGMRPASHLLRALQQIYDRSTAEGLALAPASRAALARVGLRG
jgi:ATP-dependent phosphoenolpyruvate carboxykinase